MEKKLSLGSAAVSIVVVTTLLLYLSMVTKIGSTISLNLILIASITVAVVLGVIHSLILTRYGAQWRRAVNYIESLAARNCVPNPHYHLSAWWGLAPLVDAANRSVGALRKQLDKTVLQRRELEVQLRVAEAQRRQAQAIIRCIGDAVIVTDAFNEVALTNESAARMFGFEPDEALRRPIDQVLGDPTLVKLIKDVREIGVRPDDTAGSPAKLGARRHLEHRIDHHGQPHIFDVTFASLPGDIHDTANTAGVVTILHDVTREKRISEMKSDFVSNVSHELRTPLSCIKAYMEMLIDGEAADEQTRDSFYNIIQGETNRLSRLIDNILNINRIESGIVKVQREHISLYGVLKETVNMLQPQARAKDIELSFLSPPLTIQVFADRDMIHQAAVNLLSNAIKYTPQRGQVTVSIDVNHDHKELRVTVADNGVGIPDKDLPHVFEKFYRVKDHNKLAKGTGLGLNLVSHIVETVHGGTVSVTSQLDQGSRFVFTLPMADHGY